MMTPIDRPFLRRDLPDGSSDHAFPSNGDGDLPESATDTEEREDWQMSFGGLQQWICELLIKNQQLRMALMDMRSRYPRDADGRSA